MIDLDQPPQFADVDGLGMLERILGLPEQIRDAWAMTRDLDLPDSHAEAANIVICGMGGSAIGGDLVRSLADDEARVPIAVVRGYDLPRYVDGRSLVVVSSFSGATEETLSAFDQALERGARLIALTQGGPLLDRAQSHGVPVARFAFAGQPREAIGYSMVLMLGVLCRLRYLSDRAPDVDRAATTLSQMLATIGPDVPAESNPAKRLAQRLYGKLGLVYAGGLLADVARRWKGQLNENAKHWSFFEVLPELNHNAVLGYQFPTDIAPHVLVVTLSSSLNNPRVRVRERVTAELLARWGVATEVVNARGTSPLEHVLSTSYVGDFVSYYLALVNDVDPSDINTITFLKARLERENHG
ncbi:MAG TPA: bifunctional phosphoglucose/phosphomannose isomerase [Chloroflexota bacterium]|nr:bifunctional phosphoglucose/phosphomannose isomerase [Chloroflexota bacterium]